MGQKSLCLAKEAAIFLQNRNFLGLDVRAWFFWPFSPTFHVIEVTFPFRAGYL